MGTLLTNPLDRIQEKQSELAGEYKTQAVTLEFYARKYTKDATTRFNKGDEEGARRSLKAAAQWRKTARTLRMRAHEADLAAMHAMTSQATAEMADGMKDAASAMASAAHKTNPERIKRTTAKFKAGRKALQDASQQLQDAFAEDEDTDEEEEANTERLMQMLRDGQTLDIQSLLPDTPSPPVAPSAPVEQSEQDVFLEQRLNQLSS